MMIGDILQEPVANTDIPVALIGVAGSIVGAVLMAVVAIFKRDIRRFFLGKRSPNALLAEWEANWEITDPPNHPKAQLTDLVTFRALDGDAFSGSGQNPDFGTYNVKGTDAGFAVTLLLRGRGDAASLVGTVLLAKNATVDTLTGVWAQYTDAHILVSGRVVMKKKK